MSERSPEEIARMAEFWMDVQADVPMIMQEAASTIRTLTANLEEAQSLARKRHQDYIDGQSQIWGLNKKIIAAESSLSSLRERVREFLECTIHECEREPSQGLRQVVAYNARAFLSTLPHDGEG